MIFTYEYCFVLINRTASHVAVGWSQIWFLLNFSDGVRERLLKRTTSWILRFTSEGRDGIVRSCDRQSESAGETGVSRLSKRCPVALSRAGLMAQRRREGWLQCQTGTGTLCSFYLFILTGRQPRPPAECQSSCSPAVRSTIIKHHKQRHSIALFRDCRIISHLFPWAALTEGFFPLI